MYRYFMDLRSGAFIFCTKDDSEWPPRDYPLMEVSEDAIKSYLLDYDYEKEDTANGIS